MVLSICHSKPKLTLLEFINCISICDEQLNVKHNCSCTKYKRKAKFPTKRVSRAWLEQTKVTNLHLQRTRSIKPPECIPLLAYFREGKKITEQGRSAEKLLSSKWADFSQVCGGWHFLLTASSNSPSSGWCRQHVSRWGSAQLCWCHQNCAKLHRLSLWLCNPAPSC